ncbi:7076_t:CDS:2 [Funneliformis caledonium]|uniref:7076_t:CDS:1 n=1 Tax=Funneliformis caledonium TaxID=1117310 RepID=A0A9N8VT04_9GLOM|nr:7076_t:CDS:2 [Funneliformis caledonium]
MNDLYSLLRSIDEKGYAHEFAKKKTNKILSNYDSRNVTSASTLQALGEHRKARIAIEICATKTREEHTVTTTKRFFDERKEQQNDSNEEDIENNPFLVSGEKSSTVSFQDQFSPFLGEKSSNDESEDDEIAKENIDEANISDISEEIDGDQSSGTNYNDPRDVSPSLVSIMEAYCKKENILHMRAIFHIVS